MKTKAAVFLAQGFEDIEAVVVIDLLRRVGIEVAVVGVNSSQVIGSRGVKIIVDKQIEDLEDKFDAYILPGGMPGASNLAVNERLSNLLKEGKSQGKLIAAICASPAIVLAPLGILDNLKATCYPGMQTYFSKTTQYIEQPVVADTNIVTSQSPATAFIFALKIIERFRSIEMVNSLKKEILFI